MHTRPCAHEPGPVHLTRKLSAGERRRCRLLRGPACRAGCRRCRPEPGLLQPPRQWHLRRGLRAEPGGPQHLIWHRGPLCEAPHCMSWQQQAAAVLRACCTPLMAKCTVPVPPYAMHLTHAGAAMQAALLLILQHGALLSCPCKPCRPRGVGRAAAVRWRLCQHVPADARARGRQARQALRRGGGGHGARRATCAELRVARPLGRLAGEGACLSCSSWPIAVTAARCATMTCTQKPCFPGPSHGCTKASSTQTGYGLRQCVSSSLLQRECARPHVACAGGTRRRTTTCRSRSSLRKRSPPRRAPAPQPSCPTSTFPYAFTYNASLYEFGIDSDAHTYAVSAMVAHQANRVRPL